jgi:hypothetical protein
MFKLLEIELFDHPFFKSLSIKFVDEGEEKAEIYTTLIIGPNGTGKSQILLAIINIFNSLEDIENIKKKYSFPYNYRLKYINFGITFNLNFFERRLTINGSDYTIADRLLLPSKILISAFSFNDKYPLRENRGKIQNPKYHYLGLKSTTNNIFLSKPPKSAISNLYDAFVAGKDILPLKEAFTTLELKPEIRIIYKPGPNYKFFNYSEFYQKPIQDVELFVKTFTDYLVGKTKRKSMPELKRLGMKKMIEF